MRYFYTNNIFSVERGYSIVLVCYFQDSNSFLSKWNIGPHHCQKKDYYFIRRRIFKPFTEGAGLLIIYVYLTCHGSCLLDTFKLKFTIIVN